VDPLVSIVVDNYNYARFLAAALDSALAQTHPRVEVVVVDDGSTDDSLAVIEGYGSRVHPVRRSVNGGQAAALNAGFAASAGSVVIFLDADDELYPSAAADVVAALGPEVAKVHGALDEVDAAGRPLGRTNPSDAAALAEGDVRLSLLSTGRYVCPVMSGNAFPRWLLERILPIPEPEFPSSADGYLVALAGLHGPVAATAARLGRYRRHGGNVWGGVPTATSLGNQSRREMARYAALRREAAALGMHVPDRVDLNDLSGLRTRLASLRLAGGAHPVAGDTRWNLVRAAVRAAWRCADLDTRRRVVFTAWLLVVGAAPRALAQRAVTRFYAPPPRAAAA